MLAVTKNNKEPILIFLDMSQAEFMKTLDEANLTGTDTYNMLKHTI